MDEVCRICLEDATQIHSVCISYKVSIDKTVSEIISECAAIEVSEEDLLPKSLCLKCYHQLIILSDFRQLIIRSDKHLKEKISCIELERDILYNDESSVDISDSADALASELAEKLDSEDADSKEFLSKLEVFIKNESPLCSNKETGITNKDSVVSSNQTKVNIALDSKVKKEFVPSKPGRKPSKNIKDKRKVHEFKCDICKKVLFGRSNRLEQHIIMAHSDIKNYGCNNCDKKFKSKQQLANHIRVHTGEKPYCCEVCQETFASPQNLFNHKKKHTGAHKNYKCDSCEKGYATPGELVTHKRIVHTGEKPFLCEICSRAYSSVRNLGLHIRSVHEKNEKCPTCGRMLSIKRIKQHIQKHQDREEGIRRYTCEKCGKGFFSSHALKKHHVVHTGERPFSCEICHKSFSQKSAVDTHMRTHSDVRSFCCELCAKTFKYKQHLHLHMTKNHKDWDRKNTLLNNDKVLSKPEDS